MFGGKTFTGKLNFILRPVMYKHITAYYYQDTIQFRPRRHTKPPSFLQTSPQDGCNIPRSYSKRFVDYKGSRKLSDTLSSCLKKNESFLDDIKLEEKSSDNFTTSFNVDIEIPRKGNLCRHLIVQFC